MTWAGGFNHLHGTVQTVNEKNAIMYLDVTGSHWAELLHTTDIWLSCKWVLGVQCWANCSFKPTADSAKILACQRKVSSHYWFGRYLHLPPSSTSCSLPAGDFVRGNHRTAGSAGVPPAGLSAVLSDQSEEEGKEGRRPGEACPERRQGERRRSLQTGRERRRRRPWWQRQWWRWSWSIDGFFFAGGEKHHQTQRALPGGRDWEVPEHWGGYQSKAVWRVWLTKQCVLEGLTVSLFFVCCFLMRSDSCSFLRTLLLEPLLRPTQWITSVQV